MMETVDAATTLPAEVTIITDSDGWRQETLQLRSNREEESTQIQAFVDLFEKAIPDIKRLSVNSDGLSLADYRSR